jgi:hypothetical protein
LDNLARYPKMDRTEWLHFITPSPSLEEMIYSSMHYQAGRTDYIIPRAAMRLSR